MAHAAILSLAQTTAEIIFLHPISQTTKQQIRSIYEPFIFLKEFLEEFPNEMPNNLYDRIKDTAREAEDFVVSFMSEEMNPSHCCAALAPKSTFKRQMKRIMQEINSITMEVKNMKHNEAATIIKADASSSSASGLPSRISPISKADYMVGLHEDLVAIKSRLSEESPNLQAIPICGMGGIGKTTLARSVDPLTVQGHLFTYKEKAAALTSRLDPISKTDYVVGLNKDLVAIKSRLCEESPYLQVIPICGMGGIGKTTLARSVYDDPLTVQHFDVRVWVTVSQDYNADVILSGILASLKEFDKEKWEKSSGLGEKVFKILKSRRYLIVMDDIWSVEAWDEIRAILPDDGNGSRVILTTRLTDVASYPNPCSPLHMMRLMNEDQSCDLLKKKVFGNQDCPLELERIVEVIARNCRGLPLAIVVVAGILSTVGMDPSSWRDIARDVKSAVASEGQFENILSLSYTHLPHHLRPCFLYLGMFPEDLEICVSKLVKIWVAENFLRRPDESKSLEEEAEECLEDLVRRSLVVVSKRKFDGKMKTCSLHDMVRDLCVRKAHAEKFFLDFGGWNDRRFYPLAIRKNQPRLSVTRYGLRHLPEIYGETTHAIMCFHDISDTTLQLLLKRFRLLRVLDVGDDYVTLTPLPDELFGLFHLVYLAIYYYGTIPAAISKLENLQTLQLRAKNEWRLSRAHSVCLPHEIWRMPKLRHLVFCGWLPYPEGITTSGLENLQTLSIVSHAVCSERILRMIRNLKKLEIDCSDYSSGQNFLNNLVHLRQLEDLKLRSSFSNSFCHKDFSFPWTLKKLTLSHLFLPWEEMTIVGSLPNLRVLKLTRQACKGNTWETREGEFPLLEFLLIEKSDLEHWITESSHFPMLKCLALDYCWQLSEIPEGIGEIPTLELIEVKGKGRKSLAESANRILDQQMEWGNDSLQVRFMIHR